MKNSIHNTLLALGLLLISTAASASLPDVTVDSNLTRSTINEGISKIVKIRANKVTSDMRGIGFETNYGEKISLDQVRFLNPNSKSALSKVLQRDRIELISGEIIYREEVQYGLIQQQEMAMDFQFPNFVGKAPHVPD